MMIIIHGMKKKFIIIPFHIRLDLGLNLVEYVFVQLEKLESYSLIMHLLLRISQKISYRKEYLKLIISEERWKITSKKPKMASILTRQIVHGSSNITRVRSEERRVVK